MYLYTSDDRDDAYSSKEEVLQLCEEGEILDEYKKTGRRFEVVNSGPRLVEVTKSGNKKEKK